MNNAWKQGRRRRRTNRSSRKSEDSLSDSCLSSSSCFTLSSLDVKYMKMLLMPDLFSLPVLSSLFSVCNVCVLCYCPCGWVQYTWQDTQSVYCLSFWFSWWFCWWKKSVCLVSCYIMSIDTHKEIPIQVLMTSKDMPPFPKQYNVRGKYHVKVTWLSPSPSVDNNRRSKQWCFCKQHQQQQETRV